MTVNSNKKFLISMDTIEGKWRCLSGLLCAKTSIPLVKQVFPSAHTNLAAAKKALCFSPQMTCKIAFQGRPFSDSVERGILTATHKPSHSQGCGPGTLRPPGVWSHSHTPLDSNAIRKCFPPICTAWEDRSLCCKPPGTGVGVGGCFVDCQ